MVDLHAKSFFFFSTCGACLEVVKSNYSISYRAKLIIVSLGTPK